MNFPQKFLHVKKSILKDAEGNPVIKNGQEQETYSINTVLSGILTKKRQIVHVENENSFESVYMHNVRIDPTEIDFKEIIGGDLMILLDTRETEIIQNGILNESVSGQLVFNQDGSLVILIDEKEIAKIEKNYEIPFFVETPFPVFRPSRQKELWYIRCELRRTNTSNV